MVITLYTGLDEQYALLDQGTWGTSPATNAAGQGLHIGAWDLKPTINFRERDVAKAQRYDKAEDMIADEKGVVHSPALPAIPFLKDQGDKFLYSVMQAVTEGTATPFAKTFAFGQTQPDFSASGGYFLGVVNKMPVASTSALLYDAIMSEITLSCAPGANDSMLTVEGNLFARVQSETFNYSGTITYPDVVVGTDFFYFHDIVTKTIVGTPVILGDDGFKLTLRNGAKAVGAASGLYQTVALTKYEVVLTIQALWDATLRTSMASLRSGTTEAIILEWGSAGADGHLNFTLSGKYREPRDLSHAKEGEFVTLTYKASGTYGGTVPLTITQSNAIDRAW